MNYLYATLLLLSVGLSTGLAHLQLSKPKELVIDVAQCKIGTRSLWWEFGSERFVIKGRSGDVCIIEHRHELEGAYKKSECRFPVKTKKISVNVARSRSSAEDRDKEKPLRYSTDFSKFCKLVASGNLLENPGSK